MGLTTTTLPLHTNLTSRGTVKRRLGLTDDALDPLIDELIAQATDAIVRYCNRPFARAVYSEVLGGYGGLYLTLQRTPLVVVASVLLDTAATTDYSIESADAGILYRKVGWDWTVGIGWNLTDYRIPNSELLNITVAYTAGYLVPDDDRTAQTISVNDVDDSFNDSAAGFPLCVAGDKIVTSGFTTAANNGTFTVVSRTSSKIIVSETTLVTEAVGAPADLRTVAVRTLPQDLEAAAIDMIKMQYLARTRDTSVKSKRVGDLAIEYLTTADEPVGAQGLPMSALSLLAPWRRWQ